MWITGNIGDSMIEWETRDAGPTTMSIVVAKVSVIFLICFMGTISFGNIASGEDFVVSVYRQYPDKECTAGYLAVNGKIIAYSLEKPANDNANNISSIPAGKYPASLKYTHEDKGHHWRIQLDKVPARQGVQIHIGNTPQDTSGCILLGKQIGKDLCSISKSEDAYLELKRLFYGSSNPIATPDKRIFVEIKDGGTDLSELNVK